jgi:hypothetical protein
MMIIKINSGYAQAVYDDRLRPILEALGMMHVTRATDVEFDPETCDWVARLRPTGQEIARSKSRTECIRAEIKYLNQIINKGGQI